jgi:hypothetical protein
MKHEEYTNKEGRRMLKTTFKYKAAKSSLSASPCSTYDDACKKARLDRLNHGLKTMGSWCQSRAMIPHDEQTTMTMLSRKVGELRSAVDKAGWRAVEEWLDNNS